MKRINEASYSRIYQHAKDSGTFAIIGSEDKDTHQDRYNELKQLVKTYEHNYEHLGYNRLAGTYKYQDTGEVANEKSLIIYGISKEDALKIAKAINQESIIWKDATFFGIIDADGNVIQTFSKATLNRSKAEKQGIGSKLRSDQNNTYGYAFEGVKGMNKKRLSESIMMYIKESESPISYESFKGQVLNDVEMYQENMMYDDEDVFGGTEDSYANEMIEQNLFDTIYYNIKHNYMSDDAAGNTATQVMWYLLDAIKDGTIDEKIIKEVYDKYVVDKKEKGKKIQESVEPSYTLTNAEAYDDESVPESNIEYYKSLQPNLKYDRYQGSDGMWFVTMTGSKKDILDLVSKKLKWYTPEEVDDMIKNETWVVCNESNLKESSIDDLKNGAVITIGGKKNYDPASFKYRDGKVYYKSKHMTGNTWAEHPNNLEGISKHFDRMEKEGFTLTKDDDADEEISKEETSKGSTMEQDDVDMLKSIYAYSNETPNYKDNKYYKELVSKYGDKVVDREYKQIEDKYTIVPNVGTDSEGVTYNSLREKNKKIQESATKEEKLINVGLNDDKAKDIIKSVLGQLSDGIWENSSGMDKYWVFSSGLDDRGNLVVYTGYEPYNTFKGYNKYNGTKEYDTKNLYSGFNDMSDDEIKKYFANKIKQIVKHEGLEWNRDNEELCQYLDRGSGVTVRDAYKVYDKLLGRIDRIKESLKSKKLKESSLLTEKPVYMNTWANYNENGADLSRYGINDIADGWMTIDDALAFCEKYAEDEPFINDVDGVPIEVSEYDNAVDKLNELKEIEDADVDEDVFTAFVEQGSYTSVPEIIEQIESGDYLFFPGVDNDAALAEAYIDMCGGIVEAVGEDRLDTYFDEESWKRDAEDDIRNIIVDNEGYDSIDDVTDEELESYMDSILADEMSVAKYDHNDDFFTNYFDYDSFGRDLAYDFTYTSTGALSIY